MLTIEQIRAARALLDWSQSDLAAHASLSQTGIARIENGTNKPNSKTLEKIMTAFDLADIEFIGTTGVKKRTGEIRTLRHVDGFKTLMDWVYEAAKSGDQNICLFNGVPQQFRKFLGDWYEIHAARMDKIKNNFALKIIVKEGETNFLANDFAEYRWFPESLFNEKTVYAFGTKLAFLNFSEDDVTIRVMDQSDFSESFRVLFNIAWDNVAIDPIT